MSGGAEMFAARLAGRLLEGLASFQKGNRDWERYPAPPAARALIGCKEGILAAFASAGFARPQRPMERIVRATGEVLGKADRYGAAYGLLADDWSRRVFVELIAYRILGPGHIRLSRNDADYARAMALPGDVWAKQKATRSLGPWVLDLHEIPFAGETVRLHVNANAAATTFGLRHYEYRRGDIWVGARPGDRVVDAGACFGDTALYFAAMAGPEGRVASFEFDPAQGAILRENLALNPGLGGRVEVVERALWSHSGERLKISGSGPASRVGAAKGAGRGEVETLSIDGWAEAAGSGPVGFIKMDIEGAELAALRGAERTLRRDRPRLAISLYHKPEDFYEIPEFLAGLGAGYRLYMDHYTIHEEETVLFAEAEPEPRAG